MKFGGKQTMADKMAVADALLGKHTGASKGIRPPPKPKAKPVIGKDKIGFKVTRKSEVPMIVKYFERSA